MKSKCQERTNVLLTSPDRWPGRLLSRLQTPAARRLSEILLSIFYYLAFTAILIFLMWKCRYGFGNTDETFYLTVPYRLVRGDHMLLNEWHLSQFSFFTMVPLMKVYLTLAGSTDGMVLAFRYIFTVIWSAFSLFLYFKARKLHRHGARCASLILQVYAPYGVMALSYNSLGILYLVNSILFLLCARRHRKTQFVVSGVFFAAAVLCCPYLAVIYFLYSLALLLPRVRKARPVISTNGTDVYTCWRFFTLGVAALAAFFLAALLKGATPAQILAGIQGALRDPQHAAFSPIYKTSEYFTRIAQSNTYFWPMLAIVILMTILTLVRRRVIWLCLVCAAVALYLRRFLVDYAQANMLPNVLMFPLLFAGIYAAIVSRDSRIRWIALLWLIPGILYTYCLHYSSNQFFLAISSAATVPALAAMIMLWLYCGELQQEVHARNPKSLLPNLGYLAVLALFVFQMRYEIPIRYQTVYWEAGLMRYEEQREIHDGPEAGIIATVANAEYYAQLCNEVKDIDHTRVLYLSDNCWLYLINDNENAAYSAWLSWVNATTMSRLEDYYALCPEKIPEIVYMEDMHKEVLDFFDPERFEITRLESGNWFFVPRNQGTW